METPTNSRGLPPAAPALQPGDLSPGFTLVELVIVLAIIGLIAAIVIPRTTLMEGAQLKSETRLLAGAIRIAYNSARTTGKPYRLVFDLDEQSYWTEVKDGKKYQAIDGDLMGKHIIPDAVYIKNLAILDRRCAEACVEALYFTTGGYVEEASIVLATVDGERAFTLFTHPMTGRAAIEPGEMDREDWEKEQEETR